MMVTEQEGDIELAINIAKETAYVNKETTKYTYRVFTV